MLNHCRRVRSNNASQNTNNSLAGSGIIDRGNQYNVNNGNLDKSIINSRNSEKNRNLNDNRNNSDSVNKDVSSNNKLAATLVSTLALTSGNNASNMDFISNNENTVNHSTCYNKNLINSLLNSLGQKCTCEFEIGKKLESKTGILEEIGDDYLILKSENTSKIMYCRISTLIFVTVIC